MRGRQITHVILDEEDALQHYGIIRRSGRYPWGSGGNYGSGGSGTVVQRSRSFLDLVEYLRKKLGLTETQSAEYVGMTTTQLRATKSIAKAELRSANIAYAQRLKDKGWSNTAIGEKMGLNESSVRELLAPGAKDKSDQLTSIADILRQQVDENGFTDVGRGVDAQLGVADTKLKTALAMLESEGYVVETVKVKQLGTGEFTEIRVLGAPGSTQREMWESTKAGKLHTIDVFSEDGGRTALGIQPPLSINSDRVAINWAEDGGTEADGVMYIRPGVEDISIGKSRYAQVRVAVDGTHFLKGMAVYKDDLPPGVDILFNTNKSDTGNKLDALKPMKDDPDNPFGAQIKRQILELDADGNERVVSSMNILQEEGDWDNWSRTLSSQMLSKQDKRLAEQQLTMLAEQRQTELEGIMALTNPVVKERLLMDFADTADSAAVHLKAAALPRQRNSVLMPISSMKDNEIYAPNFNDGERVVLIRHPHGGTFEIPELVVNNRNPTAKRILGRAEDAVGINAKVAEILSGADFDGDTALVIPNDRGEVNTSPPLKELVGFDPKREYRLPDGVPAISPKYKQQQMGRVSNLITDMTIMGASQAELARAVKHSMVVIDSEKHRLDYKRSAIDNGIAELQEKYLGRAGAGASTLISRAGSKDRQYPKTKPRPASEGGPIDPKTGKLVMVPDIDYSTGKQRTTTVKKLAVTDDAFTLSSGTPIEKVYATHSNRMKALANRARKEAVAVKPRPYDPEAKKKYATEVAELDAALRIAKLNAPRERQAQVVANAIYTQKKQAHPDMTAEDAKKIRGQALTEARLRTGASKTRINLTPRQWEAIQAGAVSTTKLKDIITNSELDRVKELATPRSQKLMTSAKLTRARSMAASGYTQAEIAQALGVGLTTLKTGLAGE